MSTFLYIASFSKLQFANFQSDATGKLEKVEGIGLQVTEVTINCTLTISNDNDKDKAEHILEKAKKNCLISNSIKTIVHLQSTVQA